MDYTTILIDADGVLTDGRKYINETGEREFITFHSRDSIAARELFLMGFKIVVLTMSDFEGIRNYWKKYDAVTIQMQRKEDIVIGNWSKCIGIGDDITDLPFLEKCGKAFCVNDAHSLLLAKSGKFTNLQRLKCNGGQGVLSEILYLIQTNKLDAND